MDDNNTLAARALRHAPGAVGQDVPDAQQRGRVLAAAELAKALQQGDDDATARALANFIALGG